MRSLGAHSRPPSTLAHYYRPLHGSRLGPKVRACRQGAETANDACGGSKGARSAAATAAAEGAEGAEGVTDGRGAPHFKAGGNGLARAPSARLAAAEAAP